MQLSDKTGISCDSCGTSYRLDFTYYSLDFRQVDVVGNRRSDIDTIYNLPLSFSVDACEKCWAEMTIVIKKFYKPTTVGINCDLTGTKLTGNFSYFHCNVQKAVVKMSGQPYACDKCKAQTLKPTEVCACGNATFSLVAEMVVTDRYVELDVSEPAYRDIVNKAGQIRAIAGAWSTKS